MSKKGIFYHAKKIIRRSVFPIFVEWNTEVELKGTGFFIDNNGHFITANHVIRNTPPEVLLTYRGNLESHEPDPQVFKSIGAIEEKDIFVGKLERDFLTGVTFAEKAPPISADVCICGYPSNNLGSIDRKDISKRFPKKRWIPTTILKYDYRYCHVSKRWYSFQTNVGCFVTQHTARHGMSGGPVFDKNGKVCGIVHGTRDPPPEDPVEYEFIIMIEEIIHALHQLKIV